MPTIEKMSLSELTKQAGVLLDKSVPLKTVKAQMLSAGYSSNTYEAVERILYAKNMVPLTKWQKAQKQFYKRMGILSVDPKKKVQVISSLLLFLVLMVYFIAIFRNLNKGPFYVFTRNPIPLAFQFESAQAVDFIEIDYFLEPKLDTTLTGFDEDLLPVPKKIVEISSNNDLLADFSIDGHEIQERMFFDVSSNSWKAFAVLVSDYLEKNGFVLTGGDIEINPNNLSVKQALIRAQNLETKKTALVSFDAARNEEILFMEKRVDDILVAIEKVIPLYSFLNNVYLAVSEEVFVAGKTQFEILPENKTKVTFIDAQNETSSVDIKYFLFEDPVTHELQVSFDNFASASSGRFVKMYPKKRGGPVPVKQKN